METLLVHDVRLEGRTPRGMARHKLDVHGYTPTTRVIASISSYAHSRSGLDNLIVMCHGYETGIEDRGAQMSTYACGYGLQLGHHGLTFDNVYITGQLKGSVSKITLFACGPANTRTGYENTSGDGMRFRGELALYSGATVIAAVESQYYYHTPNWWDKLTGQTGEIDFGPWEGPVYSFSPDDGTATRIT